MKAEVDVPIAMRDDPLDGTPMQPGEPADAELTCVATSLRKHDATR